MVGDGSAVVQRRATQMRLEASYSRLVVCGFLQVRFQQQFLKTSLHVLRLALRTIRVCDAQNNFAAANPKAQNEFIVRLHRAMA